jgi:hypothetical protein
MTEKINSKAIGLDIGLLIGRFFMETGRPPLWVLAR